MERLLKVPIADYLQQKQLPFVGNQLADRLRKEFPKLLMNILPDKTRYKVVGSPGKGNWADCPWIAILDTLITDTPQSGYYPVFLFDADMTGVYLSLNQGVTKIKEQYKGNARNILKLKAKDYRAKIDVNKSDLLEIDLKSNTINARLYEAGNIVSKYYSAKKLPATAELVADILHFLYLYAEISFNDTQIDKIDERNDLTAIEKKQLRLHYKIERNTSISKKVKNIKGYTCEVCHFNFVDKYGELGRDFIEAHHLMPIASLEIGQFKVNVQTDFAVLCSNCHKMIHKLKDVSNLEALREIIRRNENCNLIDKV